MIKAREHAEAISEKGYEVRVSMYRSGVVEISGIVPGGKVGVTLETMKLSPPSGVYSFTDEEKEEIDVVLSGVVHSLGKIVEKVNMRIIEDGGIPDR